MITEVIRWISSKRDILRFRQNFIFVLIVVIPFDSCFTRPLFVRAQSAQFLANNAKTLPLYPWTFSEYKIHSHKESVKRRIIYLVEIEIRRRCSKEPFEYRKKYFDNNSMESFWILWIDVHIWLVPIITKWHNSKQIHLTSWGSCSLNILVGHFWTL